MTYDAFSQKLCDLFKDKRVLIIGDSIMRGIYSDICCVLNNNSPLLYDYELKFNRHNVHARDLRYAVSVPYRTVPRRNGIEKRRSRTVRYGTVLLSRGTVRYAV